MPVNPPSQAQALTYTAADLCTDALIEIGAMAPGEQLQADEGQWAFRKLNLLIDEWSAQKFYVYSTVFNVYQLIANHQPHTIGPGNGGTAADFPTTGPRPVRIESANLLLPGTGSGTTTDVIIDLVDAQWWAANPVKSLSSTLPTKLYYEPDNPNGSCFFWPISSIAYQVRLELWTSVASFLAITDPVGGPGGPGTLPPAYRAALLYTLAERLCPGAKILATPELRMQASAARAAIFENNNEPPRIDTDICVDNNNTRRTRFNFITREPYD